MKNLITGEPINLDLEKELNTIGRLTLLYNNLKAFQHYHKGSPTFNFDVWYHMYMEKYHNFPENECRVFWDKFHGCTFGY